MRPSPLVQVLGFPATLIHHDTLVLDRWLWLKHHLPRVTHGSKRLLDVGCGVGAFTIGAALRGYRALGLSWDEEDQQVAQHRASICKASLAGFELQDARYLDQRLDWQNNFDIVICCENIEHIIDDRKLMADMQRCLKRGGTLLLTTPNIRYIPITKNCDEGMFANGGHVRRGYSADDLKALCASAGFTVVQIGYCSGFLSQKTTGLLRLASHVHALFGWLLILPLRLVPPLGDRWISKLFPWPGYSITLVATKS